MYSYQSVVTLFWPCVTLTLSPYSPNVVQVTAESVFCGSKTADFWVRNYQTVDCRVRILGRSLLTAGSLWTGLAVAPGGLVPGYVRSVLVHFDRAPGLRVSPGLTALSVRHAWKKIRRN
jgi:hypothetical protein